jgi:hypothetical protein
VTTDQLLEEIESGAGETLSRAARRVPRTRLDRPVSLSCLTRWVLTGVRGPGGEIIRLEAAKLAGRWITTPAAIRRFIARQTPQFADAAPASTTRTPTQRASRSARAARELEKLGV